MNAASRLKVEKVGSLQAGYREIYDNFHWNFLLQLLIHKAKVGMIMIFRFLMLVDGTHTSGSQLF